jgi:hypothetical protein
MNWAYAFFGELGYTSWGKVPKSLCNLTPFSWSSCKKEEEKGLRQIFQGEGELELDGYLWELANELEIPLGNMILLQAMKEHAETMFVHDNLGPFVSENYVSTRNLSLFALGNHVSLRI